MAHHKHGNGCGCDCEQHNNDNERGLEYSLYKKIDLNKVETLNESVEGAGTKVFRPWEDRLQIDNFVDSDVDEELLFNIPFTGLVKLKGIVVIGGSGECHPATMRLFKNRPNMTFDDVATEPDQVFEMTHDSNGSLEYGTKIVTFSSIYHLSIHFSRNFGSDTTRIMFIGLRGEYTEMQRHGVTVCSYEAAPNPADHKVNLTEQVYHQIQ